MKKWKSVLCGVLAGVMLLSATVSAAAVDLEAKYSVETNNIPPWPKAADIMADTGVLMEAETGVILFDKGADEIRYPASITKIMTLLIAAENGNMNDMVTFTETGIRDIAPDSGNIGMQLGEVMSLKECLYAMILYSANEVSAQIAEHVGGTEQHFIEMMNAKAKEIGCKNTNFTNASGLPDPNQYTTARDMALIYRAGLKNKYFRKVMNTKAYKIKPTNMNPSERLYTTHHPLFSELSSIYNPDCIGGKSGMTDDAGNTLVTAMTKNDLTYIAVVLRDPDINQAGVDTQQILDYGYNNFQKVAVDGGSVMIPKDMSVSDLYTKDKVKGDKIRQDYYIDEHYVGRGVTANVEPAPEAASQDGSAEAEGTVVKEGEAPIKAQIEEQKTNGLSNTAKILLMVGAVMVVILIVLCILLAVKDYKSARRYRDEEDGDDEDEYYD